MTRMTCAHTISRTSMIWMTWINLKIYDLDDSDDLYDWCDLCREFLGQAWLKEEKKERAPNICLMTERFNDVSTTAIQPQHSQETL